MNAIAQVSAAPTRGPKLDNRRVLAGVVDLLIVTAGALVILYAGDSLSGDRRGALGAVILGWALYYYFALESGAGQTVGKKLMKLRVVRADGRPAGMREIAVRTVLRVVDGIGMYIVGLIVMLVTGQRRQRIGDLAASTIVVDASGPATAVAEPAAPEAEIEAEADADEAAEVDDEPVNATPDPTRTITLPSRPEPPAQRSDLLEDAPAEPVAEDVVEAEPSVEDAEPSVVETEPLVEDAEPVVEDVEPIDVESMVPVERTDEGPETVAEEPAVVAEKPSVEVEEPAVEVEEPVAEEELPSAVSPSLQGLAADLTAAQEAGEGEEAQDDEPVNVKSVETVSAMDLIMGAAEEDSATPDEDEGPASA